MAIDRERRDRERERERERFRTWRKRERWKETMQLLLKNDGIQYRARVRRRGTAVSQTYKETTFALYFLYYRSRRLRVYSCDRVWVDVENVSWKKETYLAAEGSSPRTIPSNAISRLTARIKWKTFLEVRRSVSIYTYTHVYVLCIANACPVYTYSYYKKRRHKMSPSFIFRLVEQSFSFLIVVAMFCKDRILSLVILKKISYNNQIYAIISSITERKDWLLRQIRW